MNEFLPIDYRKVIAEEIRKKEIWLGQGKAETMERYREVTGEIKGLKGALDKFNNVMKSYGENDE